MKALMASAVSGLLVLLLGGMPAVADVLEVSPQQVTVLPQGGLEQTRIAVQFDLSGLKDGDGRQIEEAFLVWRLTEANPEATMEFQANAITGGWTESGAAAGATITTAPDPESYWDIQPIDNERNGTGFVRLDVGALVAAWASGEKDNFGVLITTSDVTRGEAGRQLGTLVLTVRYGFVR